MNAEKRPQIEDDLIQPGIFAAGKDAEAETRRKCAMFDIEEGQPCVACLRCRLPESFLEIPPVAPVALQ